MAKRFTDTEIHFREWFMLLEPAEKAAFSFIKDRCDCVGVWPKNMTLLKMCTGYTGTIEDLIPKCNGNIELIGAKIFLPDFCQFQYGTLSESCKPHRKYIAELKTHCLLDRVLKGYPKGMHTLQEEEQEEEQEKEKEKENPKGEEEVVGGEEPTPDATNCGYDLNTVLAAVRNRYNSTPDMLPFAAAIEMAIKDGFDRESVQPTFEWLASQGKGAMKFIPAFNTPNKTKENLTGLFSKSQEKPQRDNNRPSNILTNLEENDYGRFPTDDEL